MEQVCEFTECERPQYCRKLCRPHYNQDRKGEDLTQLSIRIRRSICEVSECGKPHYGRGFCLVHYSQYKNSQAAISVLEPNGSERICEFPECGRPYYGRSLCKAHYQQRLNGNDLIPIREKNRLCSFPGCELPYYTHGFCRQHTRHCVTLPSREPAPCEICKRLEILIIDHDHSCCPSKKSCLKCFRGYICNTCNLILGLMKDNTEAMYRAAYYIERNRERMNESITI